MFDIINHKLFKMKKLLIVIFTISFISCDNKPIKSQKEILTEKTKATVLKAFNAQMDGEIEVMKSQLADEFTFILTGQLDLLKHTVGTNF